MFLHYQPHLYEREKRKERERQDTTSPQLNDDRSNASIRNSIDSSSVSFDSQSISSFQNHFDYRSPSVSTGSITQSQSSKRHSSSSKPDLSPQSSHSHHSGILSKFHLRRRKSNGHEKSPNATPSAEPRQQWLQPNSIHSSSDMINTTAMGSPERSERSSVSSRIDVHMDNQTRHYSPARSNSSFVDESDLRKAELQQHSPSQITNSRKTSSRGSRFKQRPSTANDDKSSYSGKQQFFSLRSASRSEQDLQNLSIHNTESATFDDEDSQEVLTTDDFSFDKLIKEKVRGGLRISISYDSSVTGQDELDASSVDLSSYPLPVRLGLIPVSMYIRQNNPDLLPASARSSLDFWNSFDPKSALSANSHLQSYPSSSCLHQYVDGYYLCTPPPSRNNRRNRRMSIDTHNWSGQGAPIVERNGLNSSSPESTGRNGLQTPSQSVYRNNLVPMSPYPSNSSYSSEERERWRLSDYFEVQRTRTPGRFGIKERKRHGYPVEEAPYPFSYGTDTIMAETLIGLATDQSIAKPLEDAFENGTPKRILDIGCGSGQWVIETAKLWTESEFVGVDLVPIQTPILQNSLDSTDDTKKDLNHRISWVVANALKGLPFPNASFDFVRIRYLNFGIPKSKWQALLEEVNRVMMPGGQFLITEVDFSFLGRLAYIQKSEVMNLVMGRRTSKESEERGSDVKSTVQPRTNKKRVERNTALASIWQKLLERRGIGLNPSEFIPAILKTMKDASHVGDSNPRHIPILEYSLRKTFANAQSPSKKSGRMQEDSVSHLDRTSDVGEDRRTVEPDSSDTDDPLRSNHVEGTHAFTNDPQSGSSLPQFKIHVPDLDALRMVLMKADTLRLSDARGMLWQEVDMLQRERAYSMMEEKLDIGQYRGPSPSSSATPRQRIDTLSPDKDDSSNQSSSRFCSSLKPDELAEALNDVLQRWPDYSHFEYELDQWQAEMHARADVEAILKRHMFWCEAAERFDGWSKTERERKIRKRQQVTRLIPNETLQNSLFFQGENGEKVPKESLSPEIDMKSTPELTTDSPMDSPMDDEPDWLEINQGESSKSPAMNAAEKRPCFERLKSSSSLITPSTISTGVFAEYEAFNITSKMLKYSSEESLLYEQPPKDQLSFLGYRTVITASMRKKNEEEALLADH